ncbi:MAG: hypothetical protein ABJB32_05730 [Verrucomicrobiota bacterium]
MKNANVKVKSPEPLITAIARQLLIAPWSSHRGTNLLVLARILTLLGFATGFQQKAVAFFSGVSPVWPQRRQHWDGSNRASARQRSCRRKVVFLN